MKQTDNRKLHRLREAILIRHDHGSTFNTGIGESELAATDFVETTNLGARLETIQVPG